MDMEKSRRINRRGFLKTVAAAGAVGLGARGAAASQKRTLVYKPGVYTAKAAGISSDVTVTATFGRDRIMDVVIDVAGETKGIGADIGGLMAKRMLEAQDCSVDGVSGATVTSNAVRTAFADCMSQASGTTVTVKVDVDGAKKDDVDLDKVVPATVVKTDAVVLGCGAAGIQAALVLQAAGVKTHLLEKGSSCGVSNGSQAGGPALAETRVQAAEGATVSIKTLFECQYGFSRGTVDAALYGLIKTFVCSRLMDTVLYGLDTARVAYIITDRWREVSRALLEMRRGVTLLQDQGAYTGAEKHVLLVAFKQREVVQVKRLLREIDPAAFFIVCDAHEIFGEGFGDYQKEEI